MPSPQIRKKTGMSVLDTFILHCTEGPTGEITEEKEIKGIQIGKE